LIVFGFAIATFAAAFLHVPPAAAQTQPAAAGSSRANGQERVTPRAADPGATVPASDPALAYETQPRRLRGGLADGDSFGEDAGGDDMGRDNAEAADADPLSPRDGESALRGAVSDGDLAEPLEPEQPRDGIIDLSEPAALSDGSDPNADTRPDEDLSVFNQPPAGHDPLLFQIEDVDPVATDRRPARLFRFEPYDPIGIKIGSFVYFPEAEIAGLSTNNVLSSPDARSDIAAEIRTTSRLVSNWSVHALELKGTTVSSFHDEFSSEDDRGWDVEARGRLDFSRRTNLQAMASHGRSQESRTAVDASDTGERAEVTSSAAEMALNHRFNRLSVRLRGAVSDATYGDTDGVSNRDRDTLETQQSVRAAWEFKPTFSVFAEQELNQREKSAVPADGIGRDSDGTRTRVGVDFGATGALLRGEVSLGYGRQSPDDRRISPVEMMLFDANLAWRPSEVTSLLLTARSDIFETTTSGSGGVASHTAGIELRHAFRRYMIASAGLLYTHYNYSGVALEERDLTSYLMAEYYASPEVVLFARYEHLDYASNGDNGDYDSDEIRIGVRLRR
jgi:hypothetical protein